MITYLDCHALFKDFSPLWVAVISAIGGILFQQIADFLSDTYFFKI